MSTPALATGLEGQRGLDAHQDPGESRKVRVHRFNRYTLAASTGQPHELELVVPRQEAPEFRAAVS